MRTKPFATQRSQQTFLPPFLLLHPSAALPFFAFHTQSSSLITIQKKALEAPVLHNLGTTVVTYSTRSGASFSSVEIRQKVFVCHTHRARASSRCGEADTSSSLHCPCVPPLTSLPHFAVCQHKLSSLRLSSLNPVNPLHGCVVLSCFAFAA